MENQDTYNLPRSGFVQQGDEADTPTRHFLCKGKEIAGHGPPLILVLGG